MIKWQIAVSLKFRSSFLRTNYTSLAANLHHECFRETTPWFILQVIIFIVIIIIIIIILIINTVVILLTLLLLQYYHYYIITITITSSLSSLSLVLLSSSPFILLPHYYQYYYVITIIIIIIIIIIICYVCSARSRPDLTTDPAAWRIRVGEHDLFDEGEDHVDVDPEWIIKHPQCQ